MPRMFDILRCKEDGSSIEERKEKTANQASDSSDREHNHAVSHILTFPKEILKSGVKGEKTSEDSSLVSDKLISAARKLGVDNQEKAKEIYDSAVDTIKELLAKIRADENLNLYIEKMYELLDNIFNQLVLGDNILDNIYEGKGNNYHLPFHIVNVLILSTVLGLNAGFNKSRLSYLGMASIFYDVGMDSVRKISDKSGRLTTDEYNSVKAHILRSLEVVDKIANINKVVKDTIRMHHERVSGNGYPRRMKSDKINPYAKILGLVDTYEALTHSRPYREQITTHNAVRLLISSLVKDFDSDVMKIFINKMSVYPIGSIIRLDTGEVARVIGVQPGSPLRPVVMLLRDIHGGPIKERIVLDLSKQDFPSVKD